MLTGVFVGVGLLAPLVAPRDPLAQDLTAALRPPARDGFALGTDHLGRDVLSRIVFGARISLGIGAAAVLLGLLGGIPLGLVSGYYGGWIDSVVMRTADVLLAVPHILLAILVAATYGIGYWPLVLAIGFPDIPVFARLVRASALAVTRTDYVAAAQALGLPEARILARHVLPNLLGPLLVQATFSVATAILAAGALSFLGLGIQPPTPEWGSMLAQARPYMRVAPHLITFPGLALALLIVGINLLGDAARLAYDPRFRGRDA